MQHFEPFHFNHEVNSKLITVELTPEKNSLEANIPLIHSISIDGIKVGTITSTPGGWETVGIEDQELAEQIGEFIRHHYQSL